MLSACPSMMYPCHRVLHSMNLFFFSGLHGGKSQSNDTKPSTKGLFYGWFMFTVSYILEEIWEMRVGLAGVMLAAD